MLFKPAVDFLRLHLPREQRKPVSPERQQVASQPGTRRHLLLAVQKRRPSKLLGRLGGCVGTVPQFTDCGRHPGPAHPGAPPCMQGRSQSSRTETLPAGKWEPRITEQGVFSSEKDVWLTCPVLTDISPRSMCCGSTGWTELLQEVRHSREPSGRMYIRGDGLLR